MNSVQRTVRVLIEKDPEKGGVRPFRDFIRLHPDTDDEFEIVKLVKIALATERLKWPAKVRVIEATFEKTYLNSLELGEL